MGIAIEEGCTGVRRFVLSRDGGFAGSLADKLEYLLPNPWK